MSVTNFKLFAETLMLNRLQQLEDGTIKWDVSNQHDARIIEDALNNLDACIEQAYEWFNVAQYGYINRLTAMSIAHHLSDFEVEPLSSAWTD